MKRIKRIASLVLTMAMIFAMSVPVLAANGAEPPTDNTAIGNTQLEYDKEGNVTSQGKFSITIDDETDGYTYQAYQIFIGDLSKAEDGTKTLSNIKWGSGVNTTEAANVFKKADGTAMTAAEVAAWLAPSETKGNGFDTSNVVDENGNVTTLGAVEFASMIAECLNENAAIAENGESGHVIGGLLPGYYLVENKTIAAPGPDLDSSSHTRYMMEVVGDVTAKPKRGTLEHDKYIEVAKPAGEEGVDYFKANNAPIGGTVNYNIPVKLPENFGD